MSAAYVAVAVDQFASTLPPPPPEDPKRCACGRLHSEADWDRLPYVGRMEDGEGGFLCLRNCACGSTIAKQEWIGTTEHRRDKGDDAMAEVRAERDAEWRERGW